MIYISYFSAHFYQLDLVRHNYGFGIVLASVLNDIVIRKIFKSISSIVTDFDAALLDFLTNPS